MTITLAGFEDLEGIRHLQLANLKGEISPCEAAKEGFVTASYPLECLQQMHAAHPSVVAKSGDRVIGYALVACSEIRNCNELLQYFFEMADDIIYQGRPMRDYKYVIVGQLCVAKGYRGRGIVDQMYNFYRITLSSKYDLCITDVAGDNPRSLRAHQKSGFNVIDEVFSDGVTWSIIVWDWRVSP